MDSGKRQLRRRGGSMMKPEVCDGIMLLPVRWGMVQQKTRLVLVSSCFFLLHFFVLNPGGAQPSKHANVELMKVPNFLHVHLSPPVVSQHCAALAR